ALLAQRLPRRAEFGGIVTNLAGEAERAGARIVKGVEATRALIEAAAPDVVIVATGAMPRPPALDGDGEAHVVDAWDVVRGTANTGRSVVVADWRCDWTGMGVAELLARAGCRVRLYVAGLVAGELVQSYVRDHWVGELHRLGVEMVPYAQLYGADRSTVYFRHMASGAPMLAEDVDTLVLAQAPRRADGLEASLAGLGCRVLAAGDCLTPRSAEEAVYEGLEAGMAA
ncbi:MAG: oxidoreductase, partial [Alphaproteobacteria bacterium]